MKRILPILLLLSMLLPSCTRQEDKAIDVALSQEPVTLDVMVNSSLSGRIIALGNIYEKLLVLDEQGSVKPELAEYYELSQDGRTLLFKIRSGVKFHDGSLLEASDAASSMNRWLEVYAQARKLADGNRFEVIDEDTIKITSTKSLAILPYMIASSPQAAVIMPEKYTSAPAAVGDIVGTGPYRLSSWRSGEAIELEAFPDYSSYGDDSTGLWGRKKATVKHIKYHFVPDSVTRLLGLENGLYDAINDVMSDDRARIASSQKLSLVDGGESGLIALVFNKREGVCSSLEARKAISLALDPEELMRSCYGDYGYSLHSDYMEKENTLWAVEAENPYGKRDLERAKEGSMAGPVRILTSNLSNLDKIALAAKENLEDAGFNVELIVTDWATMMEKRKDSSSWDIFISAFTSVPIPQLKSFLNPEYAGWTSPDSPAMVLLDKSSASTSLEEAASYWQEAQKAFWEELPAYVPGHYSTSYAISSDLKGIVVQDGFFFWNADLISK